MNSRRSDLQAALTAWTGAVTALATMTGLDVETLVIGWADPRTEVTAT